VVNIPDTFTYVLNGPIQLFLLEIFSMSVEVEILHNINMLQDLLQICKNHWRHNNVRISELVYPSDHLVLQQFFHSTSIVKPIWSILPPKIICPEHACSKFIKLIHVPHIRCDNITIIYIFKNLYYVMSPTTITYRIYETFSSFHCTQFNHFFKIAKLNSKSLPG